MLLEKVYMSRICSSRKQSINENRSHRIFSQILSGIYEYSTDCFPPVTHHSRLESICTRTRALSYTLTVLHLNKRHNTCVVLRESCCNEHLYKLNQNLRGSKEEHIKRRRSISRIIKTNLTITQLIVILISKISECMINECECQ